MVVTLAEIPREDWLTSAAISLSCGVAALSLMGAAALLGGRLKLVESLFGGLDRVYRVHKWLGVWALTFAAVHFAFKAGMPDWQTASIITLPPQYTRLARQLSLLALGLIVLLALNRKIPYSTWRWWHKLSGPLFLIVIAHWLSFKSPIALSSPAGIWLAVMASAGVLAAAYKLLLYPLLSDHARYRVVAANPGASGLHLELEPVRGRIQVTPGQFGFLSMRVDGLREPHPFTIVGGASSEGRVHFVIRNLGDYTGRLAREASTGMQAEIHAPFGRFYRRSEATTEVWIAGGVGVAPFIAWLTDESGRDFEKVTFFYFYTPGREFPTVPVLEDLARGRGATLAPVSGGPSSQEFTVRFRELAQRAGPENLIISFCGPKGLLERVRAMLREAGVPQANLHYEYFDFR
jgi:predicted ferric reductase